MASESIAHSAFCFISDGSFTGRRPLVHVTNDPRNCSPPSIKEFPSDLFNQRERRLGAVVIHFLVAFYTSWAIAIVCDDYFVPCLELISDLIRWNFNLMWPVLLSWLLVIQLPNYSPQSLVSCKITLLMHDIYYQGFTNAKCINRPKLVPGVFSASNIAACCPPPTRWRKRWERDCCRN